MAKDEYILEARAAENFKQVEGGFWEIAKPKDKNSVPMAYSDIPHGKLSPKNVDPKVMTEKLRLGTREESEDLDKMADFIVTERMDVKSIVARDELPKKKLSKSKTYKKNSSEGGDSKRVETTVDLVKKKEPSVPSNNQVSHLNTFATSITSFGKKKSPVPFGNNEVFHLPFHSQRFPSNRPVFKELKHNVSYDGYFHDPCKFPKFFSNQTLVDKEVQSKTVNEFHSNDSVTDTTIDQETTESKEMLENTDTKRPQLSHRYNSMTLLEMMPHAKIALQKCGFKLSPTQTKTPGDGNCLAWALSDQLNNYDLAYSRPPLLMHPKRLRELVVSSLPKMIQNGKVQWIPDDPDSVESIGSPQEWMKKMSKEGQFLDEIFIMLASMCFRRCILVLNCIGQTILEYGEDEYLNEPLYLLYFEEMYCFSPHYQSIRPSVSTSVV